MTEDSQRSDIKVRLIEWAAGQPFNNVLLLGLLFAVGWLGWYGITVAIPTHLQMIQSGYKSLSESHEKERLKTLETYDKWLDRMASQKLGTAQKSSVVSPDKSKELQQ